MLKATAQDGVIARAARIQAVFISCILFALFAFQSAARAQTSNAADSIALDQNYPNPFNGITSIRYTIWNNCHVTLQLFDLKGKLVASVVDADRPAGLHEVQFDASALRDGAYVYILTDSTSAEVKKLSKKMVVSGSTASVESGSVVDEFARLDQNYPNPFSGTTEITYSIPSPGHVTLKVVNMLGKEVQTVIDEDEGRNEYRIRFDGSGLPSGQYTYTLVFTGSGATSKVSRRMYLVK